MFWGVGYSGLCTQGHTQGQIQTMVAEATSMTHALTSVLSPALAFYPLIVELLSVRLYLSLKMYFIKLPLPTESWQCSGLTSGSVLRVTPVGPYGVPEVKPGPAACKAGSFSAVFISPARKIVVCSSHPEWVRSLLCTRPQTPRVGLKPGTRCGPLPCQAVLRA